MQLSYFAHKDLDLDDYLLKIYFNIKNYFLKNKYFIYNSTR